MVSVKNYESVVYAEKSVDSFFPDTV